MMINSFNYNFRQVGWIFIFMIFSGNLSIYTQEIIDHPVLFDDFNYSSVDYPIDGDSSGSIFGRNLWFTEKGYISTPAWRRYNRDYHNFGENASIQIDDFGFSLIIKKGFRFSSVIPMIVSGFYFTEGTYAAKIRFNPISFDTKFIQAFWLTSPLYFEFNRGSEVLRYWSEMDFEFNNFFTSDDIQSVQIGCNNTDGKYPIFTQMDCICKDGVNYVSYPKCYGHYKGLNILTGQWYICMFNLDSISKTLKMAMLSDNENITGVEVWGSDKSETDGWGEKYIINNYFPEYALTTVFSLHMGRVSEKVLSNSKLDVDWFYYSKKTDLNFDDIKKDVEYYRKTDIDRINTTGNPTFPEASSFENGIIRIVGPDNVNSCKPNTWKLSSTYQRHASFEMDFRYRFINENGPEEWLQVYKPEITLTPRSYHKSLEIISSAFDFWGSYTTNDTMFVTINQDVCDNETTTYFLSEPYPNPALLTVQFDFELLVPNYVKISIYDFLGKHIKTLVNCHKDRGHYTEIFDAYECSTGLYLCVFQFGDDIICKVIEVYKSTY